MKNIIYNIDAFSISDKIIECSPFLTTCFENDDSLVINNTNKETLQLTLSLFELYDKYDFGPLDSEFVPFIFTKNFIIPENYLSFFQKLSLPTIIELALFLDYLFINPLYHLCAIYIGSLVNGMNPEDRFVTLLPLTVPMHIEHLKGETPDEIFNSLISAGIDFDTSEKYRYHYNEVKKYIS